MSSTKLIIAIMTMAGITYLIRLLPLTFFRKKITNPYIKAFLGFVPYSVLGAMTIPDVFTSTGSIFSAAVGVITALVLSFRGKGLLLVSIVSCIAVFLTDMLIKLI